MTITSMQDEIIRTFGFEDSRTIRFFELCETAEQAEIERQFKTIMATDFEDDE